MTVSRQLAANRRNARRSTGPRTAPGKLSVARNALRHGLSVAVLADPALTEEVAELADRIAMGSTDPEVRERAREVAAAQIDVERVRHVRYGIIGRCASGASTAEARSDAIRDGTQELVSLDRYERRAMSRRRSATRALQVALFRSTSAAQP